MWTDTDMTTFMERIAKDIATDFGLDDEMVSMSIQQTLNEIMATQIRARNAALKRCTFRVIEGGRDAQGDI